MILLYCLVNQKLIAAGAISIAAQLWRIGHPMLPWVGLPERWLPIPCGNFWTTTAPACPRGSLGMLTYPSYAGTWIGIGGIQLQLCRPRLIVVLCRSFCRAVFACSFLSCLFSSMQRLHGCLSSVHLSTPHRTPQLPMSSRDDGHPGRCCLVQKKYLAPCRSSSRDSIRGNGYLFCLVRAFNAQ